MDKYPIKTFPIKRHKIDKNRCLKSIMYYYFTHVCLQYDGHDGPNNFHSKH